MFVKLAKRRCLVVGAGKTAEEKIPTLLRCGASVIVVPPAATRTIQAWAAENKLIWEARRFESRDLHGVFFGGRGYAAEVSEPNSFGAGATVRHSLQYCPRPFSL